VIYRVEHQTAVEKGYIVPIEAYYLDLPAVEVEGTSWQKVYKELIVEREDRNSKIAVLLARLHSLGVSALCLVKEVEHGRKIADLTGLEFATGEDGNSIELLDRFNRGGTAMVGTTGVMGEGRDTRPAEYVIIAGLGKSKNAFMQQVGRGFRRFEGKESCKVILVRDPSHKWTLEHFKAQVKYLAEEYGVKPIKLEV
jgi:superfamily II DNA or RNA helicase